MATHARATPTAALKAYRSLFWNRGMSGLGGIDVQMGFILLLLKPNLIYGFPTHKNYRPTLPNR